MIIDLKKIISVNGEALNFGGQPLELRTALMDALGKFNSTLPNDVRKIALDIFTQLADSYISYEIDEFEYSLIKSYINFTEHPNDSKEAILKGLNFE